MSSLRRWTRTRKNSKYAHEAQRVDNLRIKVKAEHACGAAEGFEPSVLPSTTNYQPSAIDQAPSTSSQNSTISQLATVGQPRSLNANNEPATTSNDIQTSQEYIISLPDHLVSCQDEMEKLIKNCEELNFYEGCDTDDFYELCRIELQDDAFFQLYKRLNNNQTALEYLLYKKPGLLLNKEPYYLIKQLINNTQLDVHQIITNIRDKKGHTCLFNMESYQSTREIYKLYFSVYRENLKDWYELLSIQNCDGQTALHVNTLVITNLLADIYTPKQREEFIKLTSIKDNSNRTAVETLPVTSHFDNRREKLRELMHRVENFEYVMEATDIRVQIIYNTNNRPGAEEEAQTIYNAFNSITFAARITLKKNKNKADIIKLIKESANERIYPNGPPIKSLIVILTSHGNVGTIDDCDGNPIKLSAIEQAMCSDTLDERPKMLITQCCQNTTQEVDEKAYAPTHSDFCAVMSSVSRQSSKRGAFLGKLAEAIEKSRYTDTNIFKLVNNASREMAKEGNEQTPVVMSTLKATYWPTEDWRMGWRFGRFVMEKDSAVHQGATNVDNDCPKNADGKQSVQAHSDTLKQKPCFDNITDAEARLSGFTGNSFDENHDIVRLKCETCGIILNSQPAEAVTLIDLHSKHMPYCPFIESKTSSNVDQVTRSAEELDVTDGASSVVPVNLVVRVDAASTQTTKPSLLPFLKSAGSENDNRILNLTTQYARTLKGSDESEETLDNLGLRTYDNDLQEMGREENRKKTFLTYPNHKALKLTGFADNGWFWTGVEDEFKCFRCDAVCSDWHSSVDPFARHIQLSPDCPFLLAQYILEYRERILKENPTYTTPKPQDVIKNPPSRLIRPHAETRYATMIVDNYSKFYDPIDREIVSADDGLNIRTVGKKMIWRVMAYSIQYGIEVHSEDKILSILQIIRENKRSSLAESSGVSAQEGPKAKATADPDYIQYDEEIRQKLLNSIHPPSKPKVQNVKIVMNVEEVRGQLRCTICLDSLRSVLFTTCDHLAACAQCGFTQALCPVCRRKIQATIKVNVLPSSTLSLKNKGQPM